MYGSVHNNRSNRVNSGLCSNFMNLARPGALFIILFAVILVFFALVTEKGVYIHDNKNYALGDLDGDGIHEEYLLSNHCLTVKEGAQILWRSPADWSIDNVALGDVDNDGTNNLVITLWKTGSYGPVKPFWQTGKDNDYKNHLFVYRLAGKRMKEVWCSSDLDQPILSFKIRDINDDGLNELVVEEGQYRKFIGSRYALEKNSLIERTVWNWDEWGFVR